jgi:type II secretory pathway pseudopilin PulG
MNSKKNAFTIIELSVVLAVSTFLLAGAMSAFQVWTKVQRERQNNQKLANIQLALKAFFAKNGRLPYIANPTLALSNANFGVEDFALSASYSFANQGDGTINTPSSNIAFGMVPVSTLGLKNEDAFDVYGNRITYVVPSSIAQVNGVGGIVEFNGFAKNMYTRINQSMCPSGRSTIAGCESMNTYSALMQKTGSSDAYLSPYNIRVFDNLSGQLINGSINNVAYALISHGENGLCAWSRSGSTNVTTNIGANENRNCFSYWSIGSSGSGPFLSTTNYKYYTSGTNIDVPITIYSGSKSKSFDDVVVWEKLESLFLSGIAIDQYAKLGTSANYWVPSNSTSNPGGIYYADGNVKNVGFGVQDPKSKIDVNGDVAITGKFLIKKTSPSNLTSSITNSINSSNNDLDIYSVDGASTPSMKIRNTGGVNYIGIGTTSPTYPLHIVGGVNTFASNSSYINSSGYIIQNNCSGTTGLCGNNVSLYASNAIVGSMFGVISDQRVKRNITVSDSGKDFDILMKLKISDYDKIDTELHEKKLIAQEVESVYPSAVMRSINFIPNINQVAIIESVDIKKKTFVLKFKEKLPPDLLNNTQIRVILSNGSHDEGGIIAKIVDQNTIIYSNSNSINIKKGDNLFIYGIKVNDFRTIDYDAVSMLNVSATQYLANALNETKDINKKLQNDIDAMKKQIESYNKDHDQKKSDNLSQASLMNFIKNNNEIMFVIITCTIFSFILNMIMTFAISSRSK